MRYVKLFSGDSRSSAEKQKIIEETKKFRVDLMRRAEEFVSYGEMYWDDKSCGVGYGGYVYDGRYKEVAERIIHYYQLAPGSSVFEFGCGKGYLLVEFYKLGMRVAGIELSAYAVENSHPLIRDKIMHGDFLESAAPADRYDLALAKDCLPHIPRESLGGIVRKICRISRHKFLEIEVCRNEIEKELLYQWDITHVTRETPEWWENFLKRAGYDGDYHFKVLVEDTNLPGFN